mmetsp:Transcript_172770/g.548581  ORF Transcript_172770/g.548581 Transcript_172770/m.548581 type:complete len:127 (-) Transcript_172770:236-616(-)
MGVKDGLQECEVPQSPQVVPVIGRTLGAERTSCRASASPVPACHDDKASLAACRQAKRHAGWRRCESLCSQRPQDMQRLRNSGAKTTIDEPYNTSGAEVRHIHSDSPIELKCEVMSPICPATQRAR